MNANQLIQHMTPAPALSKRVRVKNDPRMVGTVIDTDADGWVMWFGDDRSCHISKPDYLEAVS